jgi:signal peptidase I
MVSESRRGHSTIEGDSMRPTLRPGDEVVVDLEPRKVRCGDLVALREGEQLVVHRVIERGPPVITRGDNSPRIDEPLAPGQLLGLVVEIRRDQRRISCTGPFRRLLNGVLGRLSRLSFRHRRLRRVFRVLARCGS